MFVLYDLRTNRVDCDARGVYELDDEDEEDSVSYSYEILDKTREEVEEEYGNISSI